MFTRPLGQRLTAAAIVLRLIVLPAVAMPLQWLATRGGVLPNDPVLQIVMYMMKIQKPKKPRDNSLVTVPYGQNRVTGWCARQNQPYGQNRLTNTRWNRSTSTRQSQQHG